MQDKVIEFTNLLRKSGIRVSVAEAIDAFQALDELSARIRFRIAPGFSERVVFRELFLDGLTLLDLRGAEAGVKLNMSHVAARQELREIAQRVDEWSNRGTDDYTRAHLNDVKERIEAALNAEYRMQ